MELAPRRVEGCQQIPQRRDVALGGLRWKMGDFARHRRLLNTKHAGRRMHQGGTLVPNTCTALCGLRVYTANTFPCTCLHVGKVYVRQVK